MNTFKDSQSQQQGEWDEIFQENIQIKSKQEISEGRGKLGAEQEKHKPISFLRLF